MRSAGTPLIRHFLVKELAHIPLLLERISPTRPCLSLAREVFASQRRDTPQVEEKIGDVDGQTHGMARADEHSKRLNTVADRRLLH
ncbi:hypothetical protein F2981_19550 (plasmid) [Sinorhizobium meliloti]|nr:hypothetical protein [Sinorhizobium meliloti]